MVSLNVLEGMEMKHITLFTLAIAFLSMPVAAQDRASMTSPVIKTTVEDIQFSVDLSDFSPGNVYRLGVGAAQNAVNAKLELLKNETPMTSKPMDFVQGYTSAWWQVEQLSVTGYTLKGSDVPKQGEKITFRVSISRSDAKTISKVYLLVSRQYGPDLWYLEDGVDLDQSNW